MPVLPNGKFYCKTIRRSFFLTAAAVVFHFGNGELKVIKEFIARENIKEIYLVGETTCNLTKNVLDNTNLSGLPCETEIQKIKSIVDTPNTLTLKILNEQTYKLSDVNIFGKEITSGTILFHTLQTVKNGNKIIKIR